MCGKVRVRVSVCICLFQGLYRKALVERVEKSSRQVFRKNVTQMAAFKGLSKQNGPGTVRW